MSYLTHQYSTDLLADIKSALKKAGVSMRQLARDIGVNHITVYHALNPQGERKASDTRISYDLGVLFRTWIMEHQDKKKSVVKSANKPTKTNK